MIISYSITIFCLDGRKLKFVVQKVIKVYEKTGGKVMQKVRKVMISLGLVLSILCSSVSTEAYSNVGIDGSRLRCDEKRVVDSELIVMATTDVEISGRIARLTAGVTCEFDVTSIDVELILQIYAESAWPTVTSWMYTESDCGLVIGREFTLNASGTYRSKCVITAHRGSKTEKIYIYSGEKKYVHTSTS